jgi:hypothetical protein
MNKAVEEYERRQSMCERKWSELIKENALNSE